MDEVCKAQAYILFYTQRVTENGRPKLLPPELLSGSQHPSEEADPSSNEIFSWSKDSGAFFIPSVYILFKRADLQFWTSLFLFFTYESVHTVFIHLYLTTTKLFRDS